MSTSEFAAMEALQRELHQRFGREVSSIRSQNIRLFTGNRVIGIQDLNHVYSLQHRHIRSDELTRYLDKLAVVQNGSRDHDPNALLSKTSDELLILELLIRQEFGHLGGMASIKQDELSIRQQAASLLKLRDRIAIEEVRLTHLFKLAPKKRKYFIHVE
jgi:hypothetical protein